MTFFMALCRIYFALVRVHAMNLYPKRRARLHSSYGGNPTRWTVVFIVTDCLVSLCAVHWPQVDCADEIHRIRAARGKPNRSVGDPSEGIAAQGEMPRPRADVDPADLLIRLAMPSQSRRQEDGFPVANSDNDGISTVPELAGALEAAYGARAEDLVDIMQAAAGTDSSNDGSGNAKPSTLRSSPLRIIGFSINVGPACLDDALATAALPFGRGPGTVPAGVPAEEAIPSAALMENINAAVAVALAMARRAVTAAARTTSSMAAGSGDAAQEASFGFRDNGGTTASPSTPFSFRRLHVTGLGEGGARGEPLAALKTVLSRRLPAAGSDDAAAVGAVGGPIVVSADATEHLVAGGVWSTVASIIGRKDASPADSCPMARSAGLDGGGRDGGGANGGSCISAGETAEAGGTGGVMYYIDDGCYGSLSGALLRGSQMQPSPLFVHGLDGEILAHSFADETRCDREEGKRVRIPSVAAAVGPGTSVPCSVWGPTCDGMDCVCRATPLPEDMQPGRDWLFFPDRGMRSGADATNFNGLKPLDLFYCIRRQD